jgi:alcohol dehydrogenase (cytochrome c)
VWWIFLMAGGVLPALASGTSPSSSGAQIYRDHCARCHGRNGEGSGSVSSLRDTTLSHNDLISVVSDGIPGTAMPGWKGRLSNLEIKSVVDFMFSVTSTSRAGPDEAADWIHHHRTRSAHRYVPLVQINRKNIQKLRVAWAFSLGVQGGLEGTPAVEDGFMYVTSGWGEVFKLDLRNEGRLVWRFDPKVPRDVVRVVCCGINNRGVAIAEETIIENTLDGRTIAIDKQTGKKVWETRLARPEKGESSTAAPLIAKGKVFTGVAGGEYGIRGWIAALDLKTGDLVWKVYTIPGPGEPGHETWAGDSWKTGGGPTWITGSYDRELDTLYWGVGNPGPDWDPSYREGDNLYTSSVLALNPETGKSKWYYQYTPADSWDYDGNNESILLDVEIRGQKRRALIHADRNGFFYALDRTTGQFIYAVQFVDKLTWTSGLDPKTGRPLDRNLKTVPSRDNPRASTCPGNMGGKNWPPMSYSPKERLAFIPVIESCNVLVHKPQDYKPAELFLGGGLDNTQNEITGSLTAFDVARGEIRWKTRTSSPLLGGTLATAGGLVFTGDPSGRFSAYDSSTGDELWHFQTGTGINAPPVSFAVDGRQQVAILAGTGGAWPLWFMDSTPWLRDVRPGAMLYVFDLAGE